MKFKIVKLVNLQETDLKKWTKKIKEIFEKCVIPSEKRTLYLRQLIDEDIQTRIGFDDKEFNKILAEIINSSYNSVKLIQTEKQLENLRVSKFNSIDEYYFAMLKLFDSMNACLPKSEMLTGRKKMKYFTNGLQSWMREEIIRIDDPNIEVIVSKLEKLERIRLENQTNTQ